MWKKESYHTFHPLYQTIAAATINELLLSIFFENSIEMILLQTVLKISLQLVPSDPKFGNIYIPTKLNYGCYLTSKLQ
ncbi:hypothetical protein P3S68_005739 [Capsicum galapagoense]